MRTATIRVVGLAVVIAVATGVFFAYQKWQSGRPTRENFERVLRERFEEEMARDSKYRQDFGEGLSDRCLSIANASGADDSGKRSGSFPFSIDLADGVTKPGREQQIRRLEALVKVGLAQKQSVEIFKDGQRAAATRYELTDKAWAATLASPDPSCIPYGKSSFRGVARFERELGSEQAGIEVYRVVGIVGVETESLEPWARDPDVRQAFPEIDADVRGREFGTALIRGGKGWVDAQEMARREWESRQAARGVETLTPDQKQKMEQHKQELAVAMAKYRSLKPLTEDEAKALIREKHNEGLRREWPGACVGLPGAEGFPVDEVAADALRTDSPLYAVAIFTDKPRTKYDPVATKTIPYAERLVATGVLTKRTASGILAKDQEPHEADVYELAPEHRARLQNLSFRCLDLGAPKIEFVALALQTDSSERPDRFKYRVRLRYPSAPEWAQYPALLENWHELGEALRKGKACAGQAEYFDREARTANMNMGQCWWAFKSALE